MKISPWIATVTAAACSFGVAWCAEMLGAKPIIYVVALLYTAAYAVMAAIIDGMKPARKPRRTLDEKVADFTASPRVSTGIKATVAVLLVCLCAIPSQATCRVVVRKAVVVEKVIVEKVAAIAVPVVAVATVPYYSAYYQPQPPPVQTNAASVADNGELTNAVKAMVEQLRTINDRLDRLERGPGAPPMPPADSPKDPPKKPVDPFNPPQAGIGLDREQTWQLHRNSAFAASCVQCHQPGGSGTKGKGGITLFDGQRNLLPGVEGRMMASVYAGRMPKGTPFNDEKTGEFMVAMDAHLKKGK